MDQSNRDLLLEKGWERHSIIETASDLGKKIESNAPEIIKEIFQEEGALIILMTYDCAVISECFVSEPWVQALIVTPTSLNPQYTNGRNPRTIHFEVNVENEDPLIYQATASGFYQFERSILIEGTPSKKYITPEKSCFDLKIWLAERFRQDTWPDKLNADIRPAEKRLKRLWKRYNDYASAFYLNIEAYPEKDDDKYMVSLIMALESKKSRKFLNHVRQLSNSKHASLDEVNHFVINQIITAFGDTIEFENDPTTSAGKAIEIIPEDNLTLTQLRNFKIFSPYHISDFSSDSPFPVDLNPESSPSS